MQRDEELPLLNTTAMWLDLPATASSNRYPMPQSLSALNQQMS